MKILSYDPTLRLPTADRVQQVVVELERQRVQQKLELELARQRAERLAEYLRSQNIDPDQLF